MDVVTDYSFADPNGSLDHPEFDPQWLEAIDSSLELTYLNAYFPCFPALMKQLPIWVVKFASPAMLKVIEWQLVRYTHYISQSGETWLTNGM